MQHLPPATSPYLTAPFTLYQHHVPSIRLCGGGVVVGLQESHLLWYGLELGLDPPSPLCTTVWSWGAKTGTGFPAGKTRGFRQLGGRGDGLRSG